MLLLREILYYLCLRSRTLSLFSATWEPREKCLAVVCCKRPESRCRCSGCLAFLPSPPAFAHSVAAFYAACLDSIGLPCIQSTSLSPPTSIFRGWSAPLRPKSLQRTKKSKAAVVDHHTSTSHHMRISNLSHIHAFHPELTQELWPLLLGMSILSSLLQS
jgi:hypothetical protein